MSDAMKAVLEDMGRAAREGRARRFNRKPAKSVEVKVGEVTMDPSGSSMMDREPDATSEGISDDAMRDLESDLNVQR